MSKYILTKSTDSYDIQNYKDKKVLVSKKASFSKTQQLILLLNLNYYNLTFEEERNPPVIDFIFM